MVFSGCTLLVSCKSSGSSSTSDSSKNSMAFDTIAAKKAVAAGNQIIIESLAKGDSVTAANGYTTDAKFMDSNSPAVVGRKNIQAAFSGFIKEGITKLAITTTNVWGCADILAEEGKFTISTKDGHLVDMGKYIVLWKMEDGKWKIFRDCSNSDVPLPPSK